MIKPIEPHEYYLVETGGCKTIGTKVITEASISLTVNGQHWLSFMCTPTDLEAMAIGFLYNEGLIQTMDEIASVRLCPSGDNIDVWLNHYVEKPAIWMRTSGCTGGYTASINSNSSEDNGKSLNTPKFVSEQRSVEVVMTPQKISGLVQLLIDSQNLYHQSGGVHTSVLSDCNQSYIVAEDIGRHNTLDKIAGRILFESINLDQRILITTGRISSEMLQKASRIGASIVISRTSPSSLSIEMAKRLDITLVGYARRTSFRIYTHPKRVHLPYSC